MIKLAMTYETLGVRAPLSVRLRKSWRGTQISKDFATPAAGHC